MKRLLPLLTALLLCGPVSAQISTADFEALRALYAATGGADWTNNTGWDFKNATADDVKPYNAQEGTGWFGINEIRKGRVSKLELPANGLTGELPEAIYALDGMRTLNLSGNGLTGSLSPEIGRLKLISSLNLSNNRLSGKIPDELIFLGAEAKTSKPREDGKGGNEIKVLLNKNQLTGPIPAAIGDMALLAKPAKSISLDLSYNKLTGEIPASVARLTELTAFKAAGNRLTGTVPAALESLPRLKYLRLEKNAFTGSVPRK
ncbi:two component regulator [Alistipes sp.]|uniref:two component regulator n=1 Tax=Alistipes sp. TaxID=1872444 RepID=UPI003AB174D2